MSPQSGEKLYRHQDGGLELAAPRLALVVHPDIKVRRADAVDQDRRPRKIRDPADRLAEAIGLSQAIGLAIGHSEVVSLTKPVPATLFGGGVVDRLAGVVAALEIELVIVDAALSPIQQRNLEKTFEAKVIDRTGLILEIFGARARTHEGRLQVELAALTYQRSRLVRSWTHLERQRGGLGFVGGPGESQLEIDRRLIDERITKLKKSLEQVKRTRGLHRAAREKVPYPVVTLVGYTNAGKSTLFNRLTGATVMAKDMLFATLDPTMRAIELPSGRKVILSDTVGFISDLPTDLVAAFRATLEEVRAADILVHVRDIAAEDFAEAREDVEQVLQSLELPSDVPVLEALNKIDLLAADVLAERSAQSNGYAREPKIGDGEADIAICLSAETGRGLGTLVEAIDAELARNNVEFAIDLPHSDAAALSWLYDHGEILERADGETGVSVRVSLSAADLSRFESRFEHLSQ